MLITKESVLNLKDKTLYHWFFYFQITLFLTISVYDN